MAMYVRKFISKYTVQRIGIQLCDRLVLKINGRVNGGTWIHTTAAVVVHHDGVSATSPSSAGFHDYESERQNFHLHKPEYYNFATDVIDKWAEAETESERHGLPAFWWLGEDGTELKWSFTDLAIESRRVANILRGPCKLQEGDRVIVILGKQPEWWLINIAAIRAGLVLIPGSTQLTAKDILQRLASSEARAVIASPDIAKKVNEIEADFPGSLKAKLLIGGQTTSFHQSGWIRYEDVIYKAVTEFQDVQTKSDDPMTIFFTSGTTGYPKMCLHTHASYGLGHYITGKYWMDLTPKDVHWALSDTGWAKAAWSNLFAPWILGACVFVNASPRFDPVETLQILTKYPVTTFCAPPTAYRFMIQEPLNQYKFHSVRHCMSAGEPLNPEVTEEWFEGTQLTIREGYGQSETVLQSAAYRCIPNKPGSMGRPAPGMDVQVVDDEGREVTTHVEGNIAVRVKPDPPVGFYCGYVNDEQKTRSVMVGDFYLTGDRAYRDEDGYLWFVGRSDDVITSAGYRIGPFEVESALIEHPSVAESAVVSSPNPERGEVVKAFIVLVEQYKNHDLTALKVEIQNHVKTITAPYKYPRKIEFVDSLPKTVSGKIRRVQLRSEEWAKPAED